MRTSAPRALAASRLPPCPGTRSMSPNEQKITPGSPAMAIAVSMLSAGVTQTGQPGPCSKVTPGGSNRSMPWRTMECVWPPQISISVQGRVVIRAIAVAVALRQCRVAELVEVFHDASSGSVCGKILQRSARGLGVDHRDGEAGVHQHVIAEHRLGHIGQVDQLDDAAERDAALAGQFVVAVDAEDLSGDGEAHQGVSSISLRAAKTAWPIASPPSFGGMR